MYHLELSKFPKKVNRFNMNGQDIGAVLVPWAQGQVIELGEQRWSPHDTEIKVLEGDEIATQEISMGRGWRAAERRGKDVTEQVLTEARAHVRAEAVTAPPASPEAGSPAEEVGLAMQVGSLLGPDAPRVMQVWARVRASEPDLTPSEALAAAERELADA